MKSLFVIAFVLGSFTPIHDYNLARFELRQKEEGIELYVKVDRLDMLAALQKNCTDYNALDQCFETYFNRHTAFVFNGERKIPVHTQHQFTEDFIEMVFLIEQPTTDIKELKIKSDLLLEISREQENIVFSLLNNQRRSFRMNEDRTEIIITY